MALEIPIYGPSGEVARRVVMAGGGTQARVVHDTDSGKVHVHHVFDAEPALRLAHAVRTEIGPWSAQGNYRRKCVVADLDFFRIQRDAMFEARYRGGNRQMIAKRKLDEFLAENPAFRT